MSFLGQCLIGILLEQRSSTWERCNIKELITYGLGSLDWGFHPLHQLAFLEVLRNMLPGLEGPPECYDPEFTSADKALLRSLGYKVCHGP